MVENAYREARWANVTVGGSEELAAIGRHHSQVAPWTGSDAEAYFSKSEQMQETDKTIFGCRMILHRANGENGNGTNL
jgi:hypothetical protein